MAQRREADSQNEPESATAIERTIFTESRYNNFPIKTGRSTKLQARFVHPIHS